ncbi:MAG: copper chaperone PCu(A)C [Anaerolineales bacterium]|nr:copper chaperone PCu(A)C [Anaerolineales bacterium]MDW8161631.1 copper chaperone PCu(A)C [Anaerolineales bacterium]
MRKWLQTPILAVVLATLLVACQPRGAGIEAREVWAPSAVKGGNGAVYMVLHNHSAQADELVGALSEVAQTVELHKSDVNDQGVMVMQKQEAIPLPANGEIVMKPGGYHVMLIGLKRDLKEGDTFEVVLKFKSHPDLPLRVAVRGMDVHTLPEGGHEHEGDTHKHPMSSPTP